VPSGDVVAASINALCSHLFWQQLCIHFQHN
jgi:hypothetical protein